MSKSKKIGHKLLAWFLALTMVAAYVPMIGDSVYADSTEITYTNKSTDYPDIYPDYGVHIESDKNAYELGENIHLKVSGAVDNLSAEPSVYVGIYKNYNPIGTSECWAYFNAEQDPADGEFIIYGKDANLDVIWSDENVTELEAGQYYIVLMTYGNPDSGRWAVLPITMTDPRWPACGNRNGGDRRSSAGRRIARASQ